MNLKHFKRSLIIALVPLFMGILPFNGYAQTKVSGVIVDEAGQPIVGVAVNVKNTSKFATSDENGAYAIDGVKSADVLVFQMFGLQTMEVAVGGKSILNVTMKEDVLSIQETVVTALGIKREKKALGYAVQELKGSDILEAREANIVNSLSGKISGLQVIRSSNGPAGSSKIVLRGNNSLTGNNQPLIVVDGIPMDNFTGASNNDYWNPSPDMGNGMSDINPEDIESMSVLKGASAAALYGSRAGNGVILITTKSGRKQQGLGLSISGTVGMETIFMRPSYQNSFGQGSNEVYDVRSGSSWGPKIEGQDILNWSGETVKMAAYDNVANYFAKPGLSNTQSVTFQQAYDNLSVYTSLTRSDDISIIPGATLNRTNLSTRAVSKFGKDKEWTLDTKVQYIRSAAKNRPLSGRNSSNAFNTMYLLPRSMDITNFSAATNEQGKMIWYGGGQQMNPYWMTKYNRVSDTRDRFLMTASLKYEFTSWLNAEIKGGTDMYTTDNETKLYGGSPLTSTGRYSFGKNSFNETNFSTLVTAKKDNLFGKFGGSIQLGGNLMSTYSNGVYGSSGELLVPNLFSINNAKNGKPGVGESFSQKKMNSLYGMVQTNYDGWLFVDGTIRGDWSSALSKQNNPYFYYSGNVAWVITDMMNKMGVSLPEWFTFAKLRGSIAQVGNDLGAYSLYNTYWIGTDPLGGTTAGVGNVLLDPNVRNELITSKEVGLELRFFNSRLGLDVAWYKSNATNQLINLPMDPSSGYSAKKINAGNIQNQGLEIMINGKPFESNSSTGFSWDVSANFSLNRNKIIDLAEGVKQYGLGGFDDIQIVAEKGSLYGDILGTTYKRVTDETSPYFGKLLLSADGLPQRNTEKTFLGNQQAFALAGLTNTFRMYNVDLSFLIDARIGGYMFSGTNQTMQLSGTASQTVVNGERAKITVDGVYMNATNQLVVNDKEITTQQYWESVAGQGNVGIVEANLYDATNVRLRNVQLGYTIPKTALKSMPIQSIRFGVTCTNVWMLYSKMNGIDPESVYSTGTNAVGFEGGSSPTTRNFLFNITLNF